MHKLYLQGANILLGKKAEIQKLDTAKVRILNIRYRYSAQRKPKEFGAGQDCLQLEGTQRKLFGGVSI